MRDGYLHTNATVPVLCKFADYMGKPEVFEVVPSDYQENYCCRVPGVRVFMSLRNAPVVSFTVTWVAESPAQVEALQMDDEIPSCKMDLRQLLFFHERWKHYLRDKPIFYFTRCIRQDNVERYIHMWKEHWVLVTLEEIDRGSNQVSVTMICKKYSMEDLPSTVLPPEQEYTFGTYNWHEGHRPGLSDGDTVGPSSIDSAVLYLAQRYPQPVQTACYCCDRCGLMMAAQ